MLANDADTLDQLLQLQLRVVDQKLARAKQARALQPVHSAHVQLPQPMSKVHAHAVEPEMPWRQQMAAQQLRLDELARRNAALARECADAQARPPAALPRRQAEPSTTESLLQESLKMQQELMAHLTREAEAGEARRVEAADEDAQWAAELESSLAALPEPPRFSHAPVGGAPPAGRESLQAQGQGGRPIARGGKAEEALRKEIAAAMDGLSDADSSADDASPRKGRGGKRAPLERNLGHDTQMRDLHSQLAAGLAGARGGGMSLAACGFALLFVYRMRTKYSPVTMAEEEVTMTLDQLYDFASGWLRRSLRAVVHAVLKDHALHMELSSQGGGRRLFGLLPASDGVPHDLQASKLKVRAKAILDELGVLGGDAPPVLLQSLHLLTSRRINWPRNALYKSERDSLHMEGAGGASSISATSPRVLTVGLLITRTLLHRLLLQPREAMLAPKTTPRGMANLRMIAAMLYVLGCAVPLVPLRPEVRGKKLADALKQDPEATTAFKGELERLEENGLPLLQGWVWEAAALLGQWTQTVLRAARNAARDVAQDPLA